MTYLSGVVQKELLAHPRSDVGLMMQPGMGNAVDLRWTSWAGDNGCFAQGERFDAGDWLEWLASLRRYRATCLFAVAPDVLGDWQATWERSEPYLATIRQLGFRPALVAQNGLPLRMLDIGGFDALFIGGTDEWRFQSASCPSLFDGWDGQRTINYDAISCDVLGLIRKARRRGLHVHFGRVNSASRLALVTQAGCDSADGTYTKSGPEQNLPKVYEWLDTVNGRTA